MPKADILLRIDERGAGLPDFYMDGEYDPLADDVPPVPTGVSIQPVQDGILIAVDFSIDKAHLFARFESFIVYARPINTEVVDGSGQEIGRIANGQSSWVWHPAYSGYDSWEIALTAISNTGYESAKTAWYRCTISTFYDNFESYGGAAVSPLEAIYWLKIEQFENDADWWVPPSASVSDNATAGEFAEGAQGVKFTQSNEMIITDFRKTVTLDLSADGRFTNTDYIIVSYYVHTPGTYVKFVFNTTAGSDYYISPSQSATAGWHYVKILRSAMMTGGTPDWANITKIGILPSNLVVVTIDDWRIVKADPDDATTFNDTGAVWDFSDGTWHIYAGNRTGEPAYNCSLGQIETPADDDYFATVHAVSLTNGRMSSGLYIKGSDGIGGLAFRVEDATLGSEDVLTAELDTAGDTVTLYRYAAGAKTSLASAAYVCAPDILYWVGADFRDPGNENRVKIYVATTEAGLWAADNLKISHATTDVWPVGSQVGVVCHACNCRFVQFRAGSPQTADYAHTAGVALKLVTTEYPQRATMWHDESLVLIGNAVATYHNASDNYATHSRQQPPANGDTFTQSCILRAGTYTFYALGLTDEDYGILDWYLDGVVFATGQDWYAGALAYNVIKTVANVVVAFDGYHVLKGVVNGKNGSSLDYIIQLTKTWFTPAAD